jgi:hypothetical protein
MKLGYSCQPQFRITQHERDFIVLHRIKDHLKYGNVYTRSTDNVCDFKISSNIELVNLILTFFINYPIYGAKYLDYLDFCKGVLIIKERGHLTPEGLNELKNLAYGMNTYRKF